MHKKKPMMKKKKGRQVNDFSIQDRGQSKAMDIDEKSPKLAKFVAKKARAR